MLRRETGQTPQKLTKQIETSFNAASFLHRYPIVTA
jgi:hypothetical protein